jgi:hypothetical protein
MKRLTIGMLVLLIGGCSTTPRYFFLNRLVTLSEDTQTIIDIKPLDVVVLRYRWIDKSRALVYGMDNEKNRALWLWEGNRFLPLSDDVQGFDVSEKWILTLGKNWDNGYPLSLWKLSGNRLRLLATNRFALIPENSCPTAGGFYLSGRKKDESEHIVVFVDTNGTITPLLTTKGEGMLLRFVTIGSNIWAYTTYEKAKGQTNLVALLPNTNWQSIPSSGVFVQKAFSLGDAVLIPVARENNTVLEIYDEQFTLKVRDENWNQILFEELQDNEKKTKGVAISLLPAEKKSAMIIFSWNGQKLSRRLFYP